VFEVMVVVGLVEKENPVFEVQEALV